MCSNMRSSCHSLSECTFLYNYRYKYRYETEGTCVPGTHMAITFEVCVAVGCVFGKYIHQYCIYMPIQDESNVTYICNVGFRFE